MRSSLGVLLLAGLGPAASPISAAAALPASAELVVFEAASLKDAFGHLAQVFEKEHPGTKVVVNAAGSQEPGAASADRTRGGGR
jgi:molybdate transport system substrate-binding protein